MKFVELTEENAINIQAELNKTFSVLDSKYKNKPKFFQSLSYLFRDIILGIFTIFVTKYCLVNYPNIPQNIIYPIYSIVMGTIMEGVWVLGHECGHGAFGDTWLQNDTVGFLAHSFLLTPYFSWKYSHNKHHKYLNHLILGETHVPKLYPSLLCVRKIIGEDAFAIIYIILRLTVGWPIYLLFNKSGGRTQSDCKTGLQPNINKSHFLSSSQVMNPSWKIEFSTLGCVTTISLLTYYKLGYWYIGPYFIVNAWLILYTYLQHTHPNVPHYGSNSFSFLKGALSTIDRPYPYIIDELHHHIGTTHVLHHINYSIPHYRAQEYTKEIKKVLGCYYLYDPTPICEALFNTTKECVYVNKLEGTNYFNSFTHRSQERAA